jgi:hypothetical protein
MNDWEQKLDEFLRFNDRKILPGTGKISNRDAEEHAKLQYGQFEVRRRKHKEEIGATENIRLLEEAAKYIIEPKTSGKPKSRLKKSR